MLDIRLSLQSVFFLALLWLSAKKHGLRANHSGTPCFIERSDDVLKEDKVAI